MDTLLEKLSLEQLATQLLAFLPDLLVAVAIMFGVWLFYRTTAAAARGLLRRAGFHETLVAMLVDRMYRLALFVFGVVTAADQIGINIAAAVAGIGVVGIAVGFAAQDSLANTLAGFLIFWDKPFLVGDWVEVAGQSGRVTDITMRSTRIRTRRNTYVVIPNRRIIDEVLVNNSKHGEMRIDVPVGIAYKESIPAARQVILAAVREVSDVMTTPPPEVVVTELGPSSVNMDVRVWIADPDDENRVFLEALEASKAALDAAGIEIPFHHLQLFVENVADSVWEKAAAVSLGQRSG